MIDNIEQYALNSDELIYLAVDIKSNKIGYNDFMKFKKDK